MSIGGTINKVEELASTLQVAFDAGAKRFLLPMSSVTDIPTVPRRTFRQVQNRILQQPRGCRCQSTRDGVKKRKESLK